MPELTQAEEALKAFILNVYPTRDFSFATSWSNYAITPTEEEDLLTDIIEQDRDGKNDEPWYTWVHEVLVKIGATVYDDEAALEKVVQFGRDFFADSIHCFSREF